MGNLHRISTKEASDRLGIPVQTLRVMMAQGLLPIGKKVGKTYVIWKEFLDRYIADGGKDNNG